jgi:alkylation response protein AidB-like acyl-CoA dehydrogenase
MDFKLSPEQERFRAELRAWLEANSPGDWGKIRAGLKTREAQAYIDAEALRYANLRTLTRLIQGEQPGPEGSASKLFFSETWQRVLELGLELQGSYAALWQGSPRAVADGWWQYRALRSRGDTLAGGTSEIMRNILAERVLGLPKD